MQSNAGEFETIAVPCPECKELSPEPAKRLIENDVIPCSLCGGLIDLAVAECLPLVERAKIILALLSAKDTNQ